MTFDRAWRTFEDEESMRCAPAALEPRVHEAVAKHRSRPPQQRPRITAVLVTAASVAIVAVWSLSSSAPASIAVAPDLQDEGARPFIAYAASALPEPPVVIRERPKSARGHSGEAVAPQLRASFDAAPQETFQLVRLRLPRQALATLGFLFIDPEATGVVDVDVLVGEDGLPRHIRKVWFEP